MLGKIGSMITSKRDLRLGYAKDADTLSPLKSYCLLEIKLVGFNWYKIKVKNDKGEEKWYNDYYFYI